MNKDEKKSANFKSMMFLGLIAIFHPIAGYCNDEVGSNLKSINEKKEIKQKDNLIKLNRSYKSKINLVKRDDELFYKSSSGSNLKSPKYIYGTKKYLKHCFLQPNSQQFDNPTKALNGFLLAVDNRKVNEVKSVLGLEQINRIELRNLYLLTKVIRQGGELKFDQTGPFAMYIHEASGKKVFDFSMDADDKWRIGKSFDLCADE